MKRSRSDISIAMNFSARRVQSSSIKRGRERNREKGKDKFPLGTGGDPRGASFERANEQPRTSDNDSPQNERKKFRQPANFSRSSWKAKIGRVPSGTCASPLVNPLITCWQSGTKIQHQSVFRPRQREMRPERVSLRVNLRKTFRCETYYNLSYS